MEYVWSAETGFRSHPDHKRSRPPSSTVLDVLSTVSARAGNRSVRASWYARFTRVRSNNLSTQLRRTQTSSTAVSPPVPTTVADPEQTADSEQITSGDDCTPHRAGKDTKSSGSPGLSTANTFIPYGLAISSCGMTSISAVAATAFDKSCKWPKQRHFIEADIQPHFCNRQYFGVQKEKNGDWGTIVYSAALRVPYAKYDFIPRVGCFWSCSCSQKR